MAKYVENHYVHYTPTSDEHCNNLIEIKKWADRNFSQILSKNEIKLGVGQKLLNLYLKYLWCLDKVSKPPHCPIDRIIVNKLGLKYNWTQINSEKEYKIIINRIKEVKKIGESIAEWEYRNYERRLN